jgi:hypothetical protein
MAVKDVLLAGWVLLICGYALNCVAAVTAESQADNKNESDVV